ncbi:hypothetical protein HK102_005917, partial [Quaeritorhiza haematococci]
MPAKTWQCRDKLMELGDLSEPGTHAEAMKRPDAELWQAAKEEEAERIRLLDVWELVDPPEGVNIVGSKVYKLKKSPTSTCYK